MKEVNPGSDSSFFGLQILSGLANIGTIIIINYIDVGIICR